MNMSDCFIERRRYVAASAFHAYAMLPMLCHADMLPWLRATPPRCLRAFIVRHTRHAIDIRRAAALISPLRYDAADAAAAFFMLRYVCHAAVQLRLIDCHYYAAFRLMLMLPRICLMSPATYTLHATPCCFCLHTPYGCHCYAVTLLRRCLPLTYGYFTPPLAPLAYAFHAAGRFCPLITLRRLPPLISLSDARQHAARALNINHAAAAECSMRARARACCSY